MWNYKLILVTVISSVFFSQKIHMLKPNAQHDGIGRSALGEGLRSGERRPSEWDQCLVKRTGKAPCPTAPGEVSGKSQPSR